MSINRADLTSWLQRNGWVQDAKLHSFWTKSYDITDYQITINTPRGKPNSVILREKKGQYRIRVTECPLKAIVVTDDGDLSLDGHTLLREGSQ